MRTVKINVPPYVPVVKVAWDMSVEDACALQTGKDFVFPVYTRRIEDVPDWSDIKSDHMLVAYYLPSVPRAEIEWLVKHWMKFDSVTITHHGLEDAE